MVFVYIDLDGVSYFVGKLIPTVHQHIQGCSFEYAKEWLENPISFAIEPSLPLTNETQFTSQGYKIFSGIGDSATDAWCRRLIRYYAGDMTIPEIQYLTSMHDFSRIGALRFKFDQNGTFISENKINCVPPFFNMQQLMTSTKSDLNIFFDPPQALKIFRPKASVLDQNGDLYFVKFNQETDKFNVMLWEALCLTLAEKVGLNVPQFFLKKLHDQDVLCLKRFDRVKNKRIHYLSGIGMLGAKEDEKHSYIELTEIIKQYCTDTSLDLLQLWKRIVFNVLISNFDDHLSNQGFLYQNGWNLSPVFDITPAPSHNRVRQFVTNVSQDNSEASIALVLSVAEKFNLTHNNAKEIIRNIADITRQWSMTAQELGIAKTEIEDMASAFEHTELNTAITL